MVRGAWRSVQRPGCTVLYCTVPCPALRRFLLGDGAGIGKGRQIAGLIYEQFIRGQRRAVWFSASADLCKDAERDFADIGAGNIPLLSLGTVSKQACSLSLSLSPSFSPPLSLPLSLSPSLSPSVEKAISSR